MWGISQWRQFSECVVGIQVSGHSVAIVRNTTKWQLRENPPSGNWGDCHWVLFSWRATQWQSLEAPLGGSSGKSRPVAISLDGHWVLFTSSVVATQWLLRMAIQCQLSETPLGGSSADSHPVAIGVIATGCVAWWTPSDCSGWPSSSHFPKHHWVAVQETATQWPLE